ncbi:MAG: universal stress protein [Dehalococcoidia bacterium]
MEPQIQEPSPMARILVPMDRSELAEGALAWAQLLAAKTGDALHLLTVVPEDGSVAEAEQYLAAMAGRPALGSLKVTTEVRQGDAATQIEEAAREDSGMIVICSHGHGGFKRLFQGSVADRVVRSAEVPVLVDRAGGIQPGLTNLLVTLDGSERSETALTPARALAKVAGANLHLLRVYNPMAEFTMTPMGPMTDVGDIAQKLYEAAEAYMREVSLPGETWEVRSGRPLDVIIEYATEKGCEVIVMATHGRGGVVRLALGSTSDSVMRAADRPVLLIPAGTDD